VESFNGDNNSLYVEKAGTLLLESLLPGRNYSISVQAISNGMESNETSIYQATREYTLSMWHKGTGMLINAQLSPLPPWN
jgi:hypothetical protein